LAKDDVTSRCPKLAPLPGPDALATVLRRPRSYQNHGATRHSDRHPRDVDQAVDPMPQEIPDSNSEVFAEHAKMGKKTLYVMLEVAGMSTTPPMV